MNTMTPQQRERLKQIKLLILDVDGVLTDGRLFFDQQGQEYKSFHARDGHGLKLLKKTGIHIAVISGRRSQSVALRMESLGIEHVYQGYEDKRAAFQDLIGKLSIQPHEAVFVGDDVLDLPIMRQVGVSIAVQDANFAVRERADFCTHLPGGQGAVREVCDLIMQVQGTFAEMLAGYL